MSRYREGPTECSGEIESMELCLGPMRVYVRRAAKSMWTKQGLSEEAHGLGS